MTRPTVITPEEMVNGRACDRFCAALRDTVDSGVRSVVVDCRAVRYMNSRSIGALLQAYMEVSNRGGSIRLVAPDRVLRRGLEVVGLLTLIDVCESLSEAMSEN